MSKRDLFTALVKLLGFYLFLTYFLSLLSSLYYLITVKENTFGDLLSDISQHIFLLVVFTMLMLYGDKIVSLFRLSNGYDTDKIVVDNLTAVDIVKVGIFIIGGILIVNNLPYMITWIIQRFTVAIRNENMPTFDEYGAFRAFANLVLGFLMITNFGRIAKYFVKWNKEE
ncbi:hypothetical protein VSP10_04640 [Myroides odoratimimus]|uniref:hypothetical protein n=1 Tax=Myroides odoratimimus TaxID=76832 RepID=UPI002DBA0642|nr:hypothetical protein [Myroides odoratimimus]MEC4052072.1 hypothetical protein [Myroides odoratimimus]